MAVPVDVIVLISMAGAVTQVAITLRWYRPIPREPDADPPMPLLEATVFLVVFLLVFLVLGWLIWWIGGLFEPYSRMALLLVTAIGLAGVWIGVTAEPEPDGGDGPGRDLAARYLGAVFAAVLALYPVIFLLV